MGDSEAVDIGRGSPKVRREVLGLQEQIIGDIHGKGLGHHGVEGEEINGAVVGPIGREGIRRHVVRHVFAWFGGMAFSGFGLRDSKESRLVMLMNVKWELGWQDGVRTMERLII
jgi:hypothetical protein